MQLQEMLLAEHSKAQTNHVIAWVGHSQKRFDELVALFTGTDKLLSQRAGWPLSYIANEHPELVKKHLKKLVANLHRPGLHNAIKRNTVRFLQNMKIPEALQGEVMDLCFGYIEDIQEKGAIKAFSLTILHNLSKQYPEILQEIRAVIESRMDLETPAFKARARVFMK
jgi:hypothetical protein